MANHKSAEKRARQTIVRAERNRFYKTRIKNLTKAVRVAVEAGDKEAADAAFKDVNKSFFYAIPLFERLLCYKINYNHF